MNTSKKIIIVLLVLFVFKMPALSQEKSEMQEKLNFLVGEWKSISVKQATGEESTGNSSIQWVMDGTWLQWKYVGQLEQGTLEVFTLINYHGEKKQYSFYSFNPFDEEPLPHYGNWLNANTLRLEITSQGEKTWIDFKIKENGDFDQEHSSINASGERVNTRKTSYSSACVYQDKFSKLRGPYLGQAPPGMTPEIFAPGIISSSDFLEYCLTFSSDGKEIYFNRSGAGVFVCRLKDNGWADPEKPEFAKRYKVGAAHITPDGKRMLVNRYRGLNEGEQGGIWEFHRIKDDWGNLKFLVPFGMRATTTVDGTIYATDISDYKKENKDGGIIACFSISRKGVQRNIDPGGGVNTESLDSHPFIDPKERYIIFDSARPGGMGKSDLYVCFKNSGGSWGDAINMRELNSTEGDWCATVSPDGKYLFYTSNLDKNIYWVDAKIIEDLKPKELK